MKNTVTQDDPFGSLREQRMQAGRSIPWHPFQPDDSFTASHIAPALVGHEIRSAIQVPCYGHSETLDFFKKKRCVFQYVLAGRGLFYCQDERHVLERGYGFISTFSSVTAHTDPVGKNAEWAFIVFSGKVAFEIIEQLISISGHVLKLPENSAPLWTLSRIIMHTRTFPSISFFEYSTLAYRLMMELSAVVKHAENRYTSLVQDALQLIENQHNNADFGLDMIAKKLNVSKAHLIRQVKEQTGNTPFNIILKKRFSTVETLLRESYIPIKQISAMCGFKSYNHFFSAFRKHFNTTPNQLRKTYQ